MQRTFSSNKLFLIAIVTLTFISAHAQSNNEKPAQTPIALPMFGLWFKGDPTPFLISSFLYLFCNVCFGAMAGASIPNQAAAIQAVQNVCFLLSFLLSGFVFPISNIQAWLRWISGLVPARYFVEVSRDVFVRGGGWSATWHVPVVLAALSFVFLFKGWLSLRKMQIDA